MRLSGRVTSWRLLGRPAAPGTAGVAFAAQLLPGPPRGGAGPVGAAWRGLRPSRAREEARADGHAGSGWDARDCVSRTRRHGECAPCVCARVPVCARARDWDRELRGVPPLRRHLPLTACPPLRVAGSARAWRTPGRPRPTSLGVMNMYVLSIFTYGLDCVAVPQSFAVAPTTLSKLLTPCPRHLVTSAPRRLRPRFSEPRLPGSQRLPGWAEGARAAARSARPARAHRSFPRPHLCVGGAAGGGHAPCTSASPAPGRRTRTHARGAEGQTAASVSQEA